MHIERTEDPFSYFLFISVHLGIGFCRIWRTKCTESGMNCRSERVRRLRCVVRFGETKSTKKYLNSEFRGRKCDRRTMTICARKKWKRNTFAQSHKPGSRLSKVIHTKHRAPLSSFTHLKKEKGDEE